MCPQLQYNILAGKNTTIRLRSSPFGSRRPAIPTAKSLTIARIASPFSMDRAYQTAIFRALERYFKETIRLVKQGDIVALKVELDGFYVQNDESKRESTEDEESGFESLFVPFDS